MTMDERLVSDILFGDQNKQGQFRGGGDPVGSALANFINARNDARQRALRNEMFDRFMQDNYGQNPNKPNVTQGNGNGDLNQFLQYRQQQQQPQIGRDAVMDAWDKIVPSSGYFAKGINSVEQPEAIGTPEDNTMNIRDQVIGQNYNQRIGSQYGASNVGGAEGMNVPRTPQNGFAQGFANAEKNPTLSNSYKDFWGNNPNPSSPAVDNQTVQTTDGAQSVPQSKYQELVNRLASSKYLNDGFDFDSWAQRAREDGITGGALQNVMYNQRIRPLIEQAREDRLRESFRIANDESLDQKTRLDAIADLAYSIKNPDIAHDTLYKREVEDRQRQQWEYEKEKMDFLRANGFSLRGVGGSGGSSGGRRGRPSTGRTGKNGISSWDFGDDVDDIEAEKRIKKGIISNFKSDPASKDNYLDLVGKFSVLARRNGWSRKQLESNLYKAIGESAYSKIGEKGFQKIVDSSYNGTTAKQVGVTPNSNGGDIGEYGITDRVKEGAGSLLDKLKGMFNYDDRAPHGYNEGGMYWTEKQHDDFAKGREEKEKLREQGKLDPYTGRNIDDINRENAETTKEYYDNLRLQEAAEQEEMERKYGYE